MQVLSLLASGHTSKEIADQLSLSVTTIQRHIANIYSKIRVRNRAEATGYALRHGSAWPDGRAVAYLVLKDGASATLVVKWSS